MSIIPLIFVHKIIWGLLNVSILFDSYEDKLCGLCGDYNGDAKDDFRTPTGELVQSPKDFGNSWNTDPE